MTTEVVDGSMLLNRGFSVDFFGREEGVVGCCSWILFLLKSEPPSN